MSDPPVSMAGSRRIRTCTGVRVPADAGDPRAQAQKVLAVVGILMRCTSGAAVRGVVASLAM
jgi:hypothetical protein